MQLPQPPDDRQQDPSAAAEGRQTSHTPRDAAGTVPVLPCCGRAAILDGMLPKPVATRSDALSAAQQAALAAAINASAAPPMSWHLDSPPAVALDGQEPARGASTMQTAPQPTSTQLAGLPAAAAVAPAGSHSGPLPAPQPSSVSLILAAMLGLPAPAALDGSPLPLSWQPQQSGAATTAAVPPLQGFTQPAAAQQAVGAGVSNSSLTGTGAFLSQPAMQSIAQQPRNNGQESLSSSGGPALYSQDSAAQQR